MRPWHEALQQHEGAVDDFAAELAQLRAKAECEQDTATAAGELGRAAGALGAKKVLDSLLTSLQRSKVEETAHARYRRDSQPEA